MSDTRYITNDEIAMFMVGYMHTSGENVTLAAMAASSYYRQTARVTSEECEGYYYSLMSRMAGEED